MAKRDRLKETVMDKLIERELLAAEAERLGYVVSDEEVEDQIADSKIIGLGTCTRSHGCRRTASSTTTRSRRFPLYDLGHDAQRFIDEQKKELLALRLRDLLRAGVSVSTDEVKADFVRRGRQVNLEYLRFAGSRYKNDVVPTDAEIADYAAKNEAKLKELYEQKRFVYEKASDERKLRQILVKVPHDATDAQDKAARDKANALAEKLKKGAKVAGKDGVTFAEVARSSSDDATSKAQGGELGWRAHGAANLPAVVEEKVWKASNDAIVGPLRGTDGYVITKVEGKRDGSVSFEQAKLELAEQKLREERSDAKAKAAAAEAVAKLQAAPSQSMKELFPTATSDKDEANTAPDPAAGPRVEETGLFSLRASREGAIVEGIGVSNPLAKAAFALTAAAPAAGPFEVGGTFVVVRLKERKDPDLAEFEKRKVELAREAELTKWERVLADWTTARCQAVKQAKRISVNTDVLKYEDGSEPPAYEPCAPHRPFGG